MYTEEKDSNSKKRSEQRLIFLSKYQEIFPNSPTWGRIQYNLQMSFTNVSIQIKRLYAIGNRTMENKFNALNENKNCLEIILGENQLSKAQDFSIICQKGFKEPLNFSFGKLQLKNIPKSGQDYYQILMCKAAIGKTYIYPSKNITQTIPFEEKPELMTQDFDSIFIHDENLTSKDFKSNYLIYKTEKNCLPEYIVHFIVNSDKYRELQQKIICQLCEDNFARKYCETEDTYLCIACDNSHHHNRLSHKHKRFQITEKPKILGYCPIHPSLKMQIYCKECNRTLCINCKVKGDHSSGEMLMHTLIRINQKYQLAQNSLKQIDMDIQKRKKYLTKQMGAVQSKLREISRKNDEIQNKIYEIMQDSLRKLEKITKNKMSILMSDHIELKRQLDLMQWMEKYLHFQHEVLSPNDFLLSFQRYENMKNQILSNKFEVSNVTPDMRVEGYLNILTQQEARMRSDGQNKFFGKNDPETIKKQDGTKHLKSGNIFERSSSINDQVIKSKISWNDLNQNKEETVKSKNNLLNLSILRHI